jgi:ribosomal protein L37E
MGIHTFVSPQDNAEFQCRSCGAQPSNEELIDDALGRILFSDFYIAMTDGGEPPVIECSSCGADTFILENLQCAACGYEVSFDVCIDCHVEVDEEDFLRNDGRCASCFLMSEIASRD